LGTLDDLPRRGLREILEKAWSREATEEELEEFREGPGAREHRTFRLGVVAEVVDLEAPLQEGQGALGTLALPAQQVGENNPQERCTGPCSRKCLGSHPQHLCRTFNVLYLFSGEERKSSTGSQLQRMASKAGYKVLLEEWDILRNAEHDLTDENKRRGILERIKAGTQVRGDHRHPSVWHVVRVTWANHFGNIMIVLFIDILLLGTTWCDLIARRPHFLGEHPEDLGGLHSPVAQGKWVRPASIWKLPALRQAAEELEGMQSIALHQCNWG
ncbi:unnamed protein product, partial [Effrenium voratum]